MAKILKRSMEAIFENGLATRLKKTYPLSTSFIQTKPKSLFEDIKTKEYEVKENTDFIATRGWLDCFYKKVGLHNIKLQVLILQLQKNLGSF